MKSYIKKILPFIILQVAADLICTVLSSLYPYLQKLLFDFEQKFIIIICYAIFHVLDVLINYRSEEHTSELQSHAY